MRVLVLVKASPESEGGALPDEQILSAMTKYNEDLAKAGVLIGAEGLHPTSKAARVRFEGSKRSVIDGPFSETKELVAGYWVWQVKNLDEAIEWLKRAPFQEGDVEIRPVFEPDDFGDEYTPELRQKGKELDAQMAENARR